MQVTVAANFLEQLVTGSYEYQGCFALRKVLDSDKGEKTKQ